MSVESPICDRAKKMETGFEYFRLIHESTFVEFPLFKIKCRSPFTRCMAEAVDAPIASTAFDLGRLFK